MVPEGFRRKHPSRPDDDGPGNPDRNPRHAAERGKDSSDNAKNRPEDERAARGPSDADLAADTEKSIDELASLQGELEKAKDHALRCRAEMENFKKRVARQTEEERQYACLPILRDLLPVLDNMDRAIEAAGISESGAGLLEGFQMVAQQLRTVLAKHDCREIDAQGQPFDPNLHEAISQMANDDVPAHTVLAVVQPGYRLHDRVVRPSKVIVSARQEE